AGPASRQVPGPATTSWKQMGSAYSFRPPSRPGTRRSTFRTSTTGSCWPARLDRDPTVAFRRKRDTPARSPPDMSQLHLDGHAFLGVGRRSVTEQGLGAFALLVRSSGERPTRASGKGPFDGEGSQDHV